MTCCPACSYLCTLRITNTRGKILSLLLIQGPPIQRLQIVQNSLARADTKHRPHVLKNHSIERIHFKSCTKPTVLYNTPSSSRLTFENSLPPNHSTLLKKSLPTVTTRVVIASRIPVLSINSSALQCLSF